LINVGTGADLTIRELAETVAKVVGYAGKFVQDTSKPDGTMRKVMDVSKIQGLGWQAQTSLKEGIATTYRVFCEVHV
jgi:GDP-L-fucose synthase